MLLIERNAFFGCSSYRIHDGATYSTKSLSFFLSLFSPTPHLSHNLTGPLAGGESTTVQNSLFQERNGRVRRDSQYGGCLS